MGQTQCQPNRPKDVPDVRILRRLRIPRHLQTYRILGESTNWARQLINTPSNDKPPRVVADRARDMAQSVGIEVDVLDETRIRELKMGALLGVPGE